MITLLLHYMFHKKKLMAIGILLLCYVSVLVIIVLTSESPLDRMLFPQESLQYYEIVSQQIMSFVLTSLLATIAFDFNASYDEPLYAYFSKQKIISIKLSIHVIVIIIIVLLVNVIRLAIGVFFYDHITMPMFLSSFRIVYDMLLLFFLMLLLTPQKYKQSAFLIVAFYMLMSIVLEDATTIYAFYLLPLTKSPFSLYSLSDVYQLVYGIFVIIIVYLKETSYMN